MKMKAMKTRTIIMIIAALCFTTWANAEESNVKLIKVTDENLSINCLALNDFASRIGTTEEELTEYVHELFQQALQEADKNGEKGSDYFLKLEQYDLSEAGYPYNNFQHFIEYAIYDGEMQKVYSGNHRFATFRNMSKEDLNKQFRKMAKKIIAQINKQ